MLLECVQWQEAGEVRRARQMEHWPEVTLAPESQELWLGRWGRGGNSLLGEGHQQTPPSPRSTHGRALQMPVISPHQPVHELTHVCVPDILLFTSEQFLSLPSKKMTWAYFTSLSPRFLYPASVCTTTNTKFPLFNSRYLSHIVERNWLLMYIMMGLRNQ